jgi:CBS domain containing-hemolysin-like protein
MTGTLRPDQFEEQIGVALPDGDWQTVAGYVIAEVDEIPSVGDVIETEVGAFEVLARDGYAIDSLSVRLHDPT